MSWSLWEEPPDVRIDRLALDIPGLDVAQARLTRIRYCGGTGRSGLSGEHARIEITLGPSGAGQPDHGRSKSSEGGGGGVDGKAGLMPGFCLKGGLIQFTQSFPCLSRRSSFSSTTRKP